MNPMTHYEKSMLWLYSTLWILGFLVVLMDLAVWRYDDPAPGQAAIKQMQAKAAKKAVR